MDIRAYKIKLQQEEAQLELELTDIGYLNPANAADWTAKANMAEVETADSNVLADADEAQEANKAIVNQLEIRLKNIKDALVRLESDTYGICSVCNTVIEPARLEANPSADTCMSCVR